MSENTLLASSLVMAYWPEEKHLAIKMGKIVGLIDVGRLIGFWLCLGSECDLWDIMNWKLEDILDLSLEKIFEAAPHAGVNQCQNVLLNILAL